jgi:hypothetical protein
MLLKPYTNRKHGILCVTGNKTSKGIHKIRSNCPLFFRICAWILSTVLFLFYTEAFIYIMLEWLILCPETTEQFQWWILGPLKILRKMVINFMISVSPVVLLSTAYNSPSTEIIFVKFDIFTTICRSDTSLNMTRWK